MKRSLVFIICALLGLVACMAAAWAILPAGTLPYDHQDKPKIINQTIVTHRKVHITKIVHKKAPAVKQKSDVRYNPGGNGGVAGYTVPAASVQTQPQTSRNESPEAEYSAPVSREYEDEQEVEHESQEDKEDEYEDGE